MRRAPVMRRSSRRMTGGRDEIQITQLLNLYRPRLNPSRQLLKANYRQIVTYHNVEIKTLGVPAPPQLPN